MISRCEVILAQDLRGSTHLMLSLIHVHVDSRSHFGVRMTVQASVFAGPFLIQAAPAWILGSDVVADDEQADRPPRFPSFETLHEELFDLWPSI